MSDITHDCCWKLVSVSRFDVELSDPERIAWIQRCEICGLLRPGEAMGGHPKLWELLKKELE